MTDPGPVDYTDAEWRQITAGGRPLQALNANQAVMLYRHWMWANHARVWFDEGFTKRDGTLSVDEQFAEGWVCAMYVWYGLLWAVIEGARARRIRLGAPMATDIRRIGEPLREGRNATFHVGPPDEKHDLRLLEIMRDPGSVVVIRRVHRGFARLFLQELATRNREGRGPRDPSAESGGE